MPRRKKYFFYRVIFDAHPDSEDQGGVEVVVDKVRSMPQARVKAEAVCSERGIKIGEERLILKMEGFPR